MFIKKLFKKKTKQPTNPVPPEVKDFAKDMLHNGWDYDSRKVLEDGRIAYNFKNRAASTNSLGGTYQSPDEDVEASQTNRRYVDPLISNRSYNMYNRIHVDLVSQLDPIANKLVKGLPQRFFAKPFKFYDSHEPLSIAQPLDFAVPDDIMTLCAEIAEAILTWGWAVLVPKETEEGIEYQILTERKLRDNHLIRDQENNILAYQLSYHPRPKYRQSQVNLHSENMVIPKENALHFTRGEWNYGFGHSLLKELWDPLAKLREDSHADSFRKRIYPVVTYPRNYDSDDLDTLLKGISLLDHNNALCIPEGPPNTQGMPTGLPTVEWATPASDAAATSTGGGSIFGNISPEWVKITTLTGFSIKYFTGNPGGALAAAWADIEHDAETERIWFAQLSQEVIRPLFKWAESQGLLELPEEFTVRSWMEWEAFTREQVQLEQQRESLTYQMAAQGGNHTQHNEAIHNVRSRRPVGLTSWQRERRLEKEGLSTEDLEEGAAYLRTRGQRALRPQIDEDLGRDITAIELEAQGLQPRQQPAELPPEPTAQAPPQAQAQAPQQQPNMPELGAQQPASTTVSQWAWSPMGQGQAELFIEFESYPNQYYRYEVPDRDVQAFEAAPSKGSWIWDNLRGTQPGRSYPMAPRQKESTPGGTTGSRVPYTISRQTPPAMGGQASAIAQMEDLQQRETTAELAYSPEYQQRQAHRPPRAGAGRRPGAARRREAYEETQGLLGRRRTMTDVQELLRRRREGELGQQNQNSLEVQNLAAEFNPIHVTLPTGQVCTSLNQLKDALHVGVRTVKTLLPTLSLHEVYRANSLQLSGNGFNTEFPYIYNREGNLSIEFIHPDELKQLVGTEIPLGLLHDLEGNTEIPTWQQIGTYKIVGISEDGTCEIGEITLDEELIASVFAHLDQEDWLTKKIENREDLEISHAYTATLQYDPEKKKLYQTNINLSSCSIVPKGRCMAPYCKAAFTKEQNA